MTGILSLNDIREVLLEESIADLIVAKDVATPKVVTVFMDESLQSALHKMIQIDVDELPVVRREAPHCIVTMISKRDIISHYYEQIRSFS